MIIELKDSAPLFDYVVVTAFYALTITSWTLFGIFVYQAISDRLRRK